MNRQPQDLALANAARDILINQFHKNITSLEIAGQLGISDRKLKRVFKEVFNTGIYAYQLQLRMEKAREHLEQGNKSVKQVAWLVGYRRQSSFTKRFCKHYGISPSNWYNGMEEYG